MKINVQSRRLMVGVMVLLGVLVVMAPSANAVWISEITAANPTVWYQFNETSGTTAADAAGGDQTGTYYNQATPNDTTGVTLGVITAMGKAATFDGIRGFLQGASVPIGQSFSVETIVRSETPTWDAYGGLGSWGGANGFILHPYPEASNRVAAYVRTSSGAFDFSQQPQVIPPDISNAFHYYAMTYDNTTGKLSVYYDTLSASGTFVTIPTRTSGTYTVDIAHDSASAPSTDDRLSNITVDEWAFYGYALSASQVAAHYAAFQADTIPEPTTIAMLAVGGLLIGWRRRSTSGA